MQKQNQTNTQTIVIGCDHAAYAIKEQIKKFLEQKPQNLQIIDVGCYSTDSVDYPDFANKLCLEVLKNEKNLGIMCCGSGIGVSIAVNKQKGIRCGYCCDYMTALAANNNYCNVITIGERVIGFEQAKIIINTFLTNQKQHDEKFLKLAEKIQNLENKYLKSQ